MICYRNIYGSIIRMMEYYGQDIVNININNNNNNNNNGDNNSNTTNKKYDDIDFDKNFT
jgi:hypothetical protein